jgi:hypothetical protein
MLPLLSYMVFFGKNPVFFTSSEKALLDHTDPISTLKHLSCRKCFFQKLTQFSQENNVEDAHASIEDVFLSKDTCVYST